MGSLKTLLKTCIKTLKKMEILLSWNLVKNQLKNGVYIAPFQIWPLAAGKGIFALPVDRPNGQISDRCAFGRPPGRPGLHTESSSSLPVDRPVDRGYFQVAELSSRSTGPPAWLRAHSVHVGRPARSTDYWYGWPARSTSRQPVQPL